MLGYFMTIISLLSQCAGVGIDYYDDRNVPEEQTEDYVKIIPYTRRTGNEDIMNTSYILGHNDTDYTKSSNTAQYSVTAYSSLFDINTGSVSFSLFKNDNSTMLANAKVPMISLNALKEYEYYDDETNPHILRQKIVKVGQYSQTNNSGFNLKTPLTEFYNLEPAVDFINIDIQHNYSKYYSLWYVLEDLPCWQLPMLYGEFGRQKKTYEVFLMHGGEVKNVFEKNPGDIRPNKRQLTSVPISYYTNKWCKSAPCYGDHTLCLFSDNDKSGICEEDYTVEVPTITEQFALINTLNSMRNKIANGESDRYSHLPTAANMKQVIYDYDLENFARVWLLQCLPGPEPCSALDGVFVNQLECTKFAKYCCIKSFTAQYKKCTPKPECYTAPVIGCLHVWFWKAGDNLTFTDIQCGHMSILSYSTAQILWATTYKIGCAYGRSSNGDVRVICNFSPGAPFVLDARLYCGILSLRGGTTIPSEKNISDTKFLKSFGIKFTQITNNNEPERNNVAKFEELMSKFDVDKNNVWGIEVLHKMYTEGRIRKEFKDYSNGTRDMIARVVVKYKFIELNGARCDSDEPIYIIGAPGSLCVETGRRYQGLCYDFRDPTPGYRIVAVIAPIALFSLILYDLFSGVVRQTSY